MNTNIRRWLTVGTAFMIMFVIFATCLSCMGLYVKPVTEEFGIDRTAFHLTTTIGSMAMMFTALIAGKLIHKTGIKKLMLIGILCCAASMFIYSRANHIQLFYASAILMGTAISFSCNVPISVLIKNWFKGKNEGTALGIAFMGSGAGATVLAPVYTSIIESAGWRTSFFTAAAIMVVVLVPLTLIFIKDRPDEDVAVEAEAQNKGEVLTLGEVMKYPATWLVFLAFTISSLASIALLNSGVPFMTDSGMTPEAVAKVIAIASAALIFGKFLFGFVADKIGGKAATIIGSALTIAFIVSFCLNGLIGGTILIAIFIIGYAFGAAVPTVSMPIALSYMYGNGDFSAIMGLFSMTGGVAGILHIFVSIIYDHYQSYYPAWILITVLCIIMTLIFVICMRPVKKK